MTAFSATSELATAEAPRSGFSMSCEPASYVSTGCAIAAAVMMAAAPASFAVAAQDLASASIVATAAPAAYTLTGQAVGLSVAEACDTAAFVVGGGDAAMASSFDPAAYVLAGQDLLLGSTLLADCAAYMLTGMDAQGAMPVLPAAYALMGQAITLSTKQPLDGASYTFYGAPVFRFWTVGVNPGEPATAEFATAEFPRFQTYGMIAAPAVYTWTGQDATLLPPLERATYTLTLGAAELSMPVEPAAYVLSGQDISTALDAKADPAAFVLTPQPIESLLPLEPAAYVLAGQDIILTTSLERAVYALTGQDVFSVKWMAADPASYVFTGQDALATVSMALERAGYTIIGWSIGDVTGPSGNHIYLVQLQAHDGVELRTFYLATEGFTSQPYDTPPNQFYDPRIIDPGNFDRALFDGTALRGRAQSGSGDIQIASGDPGNGLILDDWFGYGWSRREIRIMSLPAGARSLASASTLFVGKADRISSTSPLDTITLKIGDRLADLEQPLLSDLFAGTTTSSAATVEGNADLAGKVKQRCWGQCTNVPLQPANPYDLIYLASEGGAHAVTVYDGGLALTADGDSANISALRSATIAAGHYRTCLATGHVRIGSLPEKELTADVTVGATAADRTVGQIAYQMLLLYGIASNTISTGSIAVLDGLNSAECCYFINDDRAAIGAVQDVLDSIGAWMVPDRDGTLVFGRFQAPTTAPQSTFDLDDVALGDALDAVDSDLPTWRVIFQYAPCFTVQGDNDLTGAAPDARRSFVAKDFRTVPGIEDETVKIMHLDAVETTIVSYLTDPVAAKTEAERQLALLKVLRQRFGIKMPLADAWPSTPGNAITLRHPKRLGLGSGKPFAVLQRTDLYSSDSIELELWG